MNAVPLLLLVRPALLAALVAGAEHGARPRSLQQNDPESATDTDGVAVLVNKTAEALFRAKSALIVAELQSYSE